MTNIIVQKFGGTSIGKAERMLHVANIIKENSKKNRILVVVSAMSSYIKTEGTTSRLLQAAQEALSKGRFYKTIDLIEKSHLKAIEEGVEDSKLREICKENVVNELQHLKSFLEAIQVIGEISPRSQDVIVGTGEKLSAQILSSVLKSQGLDATYINLEHVIQKSFSEINKDFYQYLMHALSECIQTCNHKIPVITGYLGFVPGGILQSIGRGYTDLTAALIAVGVKAKELQIWKEVDGIYSADPRKVKEAKVLSSITPEEAAELTYYGSEVIHPFTMEQVIKAKIPIRIKNTFHPNLEGTIIHPKIQQKSQFKKPVAVTCKRNITILNINSNRMLMAYGFMAKVFNIFDEYGIVIDLIATSEVNISVSIDQSFPLKEVEKKLSSLGKVSIRKELAILSLVGTGMKNVPGIAGKMFTILAKENINIEMISQGASEVNISCVIDDEKTDKALQVVHNILLEKN